MINVFALSQVANDEQYDQYYNNGIYHWNSPFLLIWGGGRMDCLSCFRRSADLNDPQQIQNDEDGGNNEQSMDPTACLRETWTYTPAEITE